MWPVVLWWVLLEALGVVALPLTFAAFGPRAAYGYPFAKVLGVLFVSYVTWLAGYLVPMNMAIAMAMAGLALAAIIAGWRQREAMAGWLRDGGLEEIGRHNLLWTFGFLFFAWQRAMAPDIFGAEKYMDFAFLNLLARTDSMPPADPWMAGATINYYYFGYLTFANLVRIVPLPTYVSYNLCIATIGGLAFALTAAVVRQITRRWDVAVLGGAMSALIGNLDGFLQVMEKGTLRGMDYWRSSRVVARGDTINEFPFFSTIHGDLHPHFMVLPVGITLLAVLLDERLFPSRGDETARPAYRTLLPFALLAFVSGAMIAISPWELPTAAVVIVLLAGRSQPFWPLVSKERLRLIVQVAAVLVCAYLLFLPFYLGFQAPPGGVGFKVARTSVREFLTVFGLLLFPPAILLAVRVWARIPAGGESRQLLVAAAGLVILVAALAGNAVIPLLVALMVAGLAVAYTEENTEERGGIFVVVAATVALLACEFVYLKDAYGEKLYRMNTVFKLYFQAWTLLAVATPWCMSRLLEHRWQWAPVPRLLRTALVLLLVASACYPVALTTERMRGRTWTLDGNAYLRREHPDDFAALVWLREHAVDLEVVLEASGNPYSYFARFSSNTGLPTVLGWANHEGLWRGHDREVTARLSQIERMYNATGLDEIRPLLDRYQVRYILVGELERQTYKREGIEKFAALELAFRSGQTMVYRR